MHTVQWELVHISYSCVGLRCLVLQEGFENGQRNQIDPSSNYNPVNTHQEGVEAIQNLSMKVQLKPFPHLSMGKYLTRETHERVGCGRGHLRGIKLPLLYHSTL